ncbi:ribulose-5-phosphate 3-epimerase [Cricetibacter osteomyelitidis]|uniref:Ribulose-5-phosphate 3-epimerase n=1 Tax=Cricetibacter osteomyelitidis TaxID=1521931 RepID=A0A4R2T2W7_9PAST|nr:ribulose phosphate epimerase [Cricetibacter osteomyelitidis]TCP95174.1 ribulose-5-phosphate 3-epimerase [Cricetibacter osteomyelitidis]
MNNSKEQLILALKSQKISVGILASNWLNFKETQEILRNNQITLLHFDIADGHFSPMFTVGAMAIKPFSSPFIKDVHLMVENQFQVAKECVKAGANIITLQIETTENLAEIYHWLNQQTSVLCGISLCPDTSLEQLDAFLDQIDLIQILTLDPRTGIKMDETLLFERIKKLTDKLKRQGKDKLISIDGSMTFELAQKLQQFNINWVVSGSALFAKDNLNEILRKWIN